MNKYSSGIGILLFIVMLIPIDSCGQQLSKEQLEMTVKAMKQAGAPPEAIEQFIKSVNGLPSTSENAVTVDVRDIFTDFVIPKRNEARISSVPKKIFDNTSLKAHIDVTVQKLQEWIGEDDKKIVNLVLELPEARDPDNLASIASSLWMFGDYNAAIVLMGKAVQLKPDVDKLNNLAAFLEMKGGEELAIPILARLNHDFPGNSTILNNIGQAWFGLGDIDKARKYLDSTTYIFAAHPQANLTCGIIAESQGNQDKAVQYVKKSIANGYSSDKEDFLERNGYQVSGADITKSMHVPEDPLGFDRWIGKMPEWPMSVEDVLALGQSWHDFFSEVEKEENKLRAEQNLQIQKHHEMLKHSGDNNSTSTTGRRFVNLGRKARLISRTYAQDRDGHNEYQEDVLKYDDEWHIDTMDSISKKHDKKMLEILEKYGSDPEKERQRCEAETAECSEFIASWNDAGKHWFDAILKMKKKRISDDAYRATSYATSELEAEMAVTGAKLDFIYLFSSQLRLSSILLEQGLPPTICLPERSMKNPFGKLPDFDDIHCNEKIDFTVVGFGSWGIHCNTTVMNINPLFAPVGIGFSFNTKTNEFLTASVSVSKGPVDLKYEYNFQNQSSRIEAAAGYEMGKNGPIEIGAKFTTAIEFDRTGITDINSGVGVEASVGNKVGGIKVESSSSIGWNAGVSNVTDGKISGLAGDIMKMYRGK